MKLLLPLVVCIFAISSSAQTARVISENANLRGTPKTSGKIVDTLPEFTNLEIIKQKGVWFLVQASEYVGWIHGNTIRLTETSTKIDRLSVFPSPSRRTRKPSRTRKRKRSRANRSYIRGPRGGCYYINRNGNKTYVSRSLCK